MEKRAPQGFFYITHASAVPSAASVLQTTGSPVSRFVNPIPVAFIFPYMDWMHGERGQRRYNIQPTFRLYFTFRYMYKYGEYTG